MKILILTSEGHIMANFLIKNLLFNYSRDDEFYIFESEKLLGGHTSFGALKKYIKVSGLYYVVNMIMKVYASKIIWQIGRLTGKKDIASSLVNWRYLKVDNLERFVVEDIKSEKILKQIKEINPDIILSLLFNQIIPETVYSIPQLGTYNLHPAMLPEYKGVSPTFWSLAEGRQESGVTLHKVVKKIDEGDIVAQRKVDIKETDSEHSLYAISTVIASDMIRELLVDIKNGKEIRSITTDPGGFYRSLPTKQAVKEFRKNKRKLFRFSELLKSFDKL